MDVVGGWIDVDGELCWWMDSARLHERCFLRPKLHHPPPRIPVPRPIYTGTGPSRDQFTPTEESP